MNSTQAQQLAMDLLATALPQRWQHVQAVAAKAEQFGGELFDDVSAQILVSAAWLHDVGYAPSVVATGFHPVDGALWLLRKGVDPRICCLVANHSCAVIEAEERDVAGEMLAFCNEQTLLSDALTFADMSTGPLGQPLEVAERIAEIKSRYGKDHVVFRFIVRAEPILMRIADRIHIARAAPKNHQNVAESRN